MENDSLVNNTTSPSPIPPQDAQPQINLVTTEKLKVEKKSPIGLIVGLVVAIVFALGLAILSGYLYFKFVEASTNLDSQIESAVAVAVREKAEDLEAEFLEREKDPYKTFAGPADYGELSFSYPKTWSVYVSKDASNGGNFEAYLNPSEVYPVSNTTINSLRVSILAKDYDKVISDYSKMVQNGTLKMTVVTVNGQTANRYEGEITKDIKGIVTIMKIRDKTAALQTDSMLFVKDYNKIIESVKFNL